MNSSPSSAPFSASPRMSPARAGSTPEDWSREWLNTGAFMEWLLFGAALIRGAGGATDRGLRALAKPQSGRSPPPPASALARREVTRMHRRKTGVGVRQKGSRRRAHGAPACGLKGLADGPARRLLFQGAKRPVPSAVKAMRDMKPSSCSISRLAATAGAAMTMAMISAQAFAADKVGQPTDGAMDFQPGVTQLRDQVMGFHTWILLPVLFGISILVL